MPLPLHIASTPPFRCTIELLFRTARDGPQVSWMNRFVTICEDVLFSVHSTHVSSTAAHATLSYRLMWSTIPLRARTAPQPPTGSATALAHRPNRDFGPKVWGIYEGASHIIDHTRLQELPSHSLMPPLLPNQHWNHTLRFTLTSGLRGPHFTALPTSLQLTPSRQSSWACMISFQLDDSRQSLNEPTTVLYPLTHAASINFNRRTA